MKLEQPTERLLFFLRITDYNNNKGVGEMDEILKQILSELKELIAGQQETNTRLTNIETDITELKADVSGLKTDVKELKTDNKIIKQAVLETNETVKRIEGRQEHQQRIIEQLAYKSVEHDAEIKRIK